MSMEMLNELMDSMIRGSLVGFIASFWIMGLVAVWKWFFGVVKRFLRYLFPGLCQKANKIFHKKKGTDVNAENTHTEY